MLKGLILLQQLIIAVSPSLNEELVSRIDPPYIVVIHCLNVRDFSGLDEASNNMN